MKESEGFEPCSLDGNSTSFVGWESLTVQLWNFLLAESEGD